MGSTGGRLDRLGAPLVVAAFYISGHGFGHATRDIEIIRALGRQRPGIEIVVRTAAPAWLFEDLGNVSLTPAEIDTGVVQLDSLRVDLARTARDADRFYADVDRHIADEARWLVSQRAGVVVGDIPPIAFAAAAAAAIPSVAVSNFTWDWIYEHTPGFEAIAPRALAAIRRAYASATLALRLPLHGGFAPMSHVTRDIALVARRSAYSRAEARRLLHLPEHDRVVLASFGGHGLDLDYRQIAAANGFTLVVTDHEAGSVVESAALRCFSQSALTRLGMRYEDMVAASDAVVTKPGYGIVSECFVNGTALVFASRGSFVEQDILVAEMPRLLRCQRIEQDDLLGGRWHQAVETVLALPAPLNDVRADGADEAAAAILAVA